MAHARSASGMPARSRFASRTVPGATCTGPVGDDAQPQMVRVTVTPGLSRFRVQGIADQHGREVRDRLRAAIIASGLAWPLGAISVEVAGPIPERTADLDLPMALSILKATGRPPGDVDVTGFRGALGLDGSIRGDATTRARDLRELVDALQADAGPCRQAGPSASERCRALDNSSRAIAALVDELGDDVPGRVREALVDAEELFDGILDELQARIEGRSQTAGAKGVA